MAFFKGEKSKQFSLVFLWFFCYVGRQTDKTGAQVANASLAQILSKDVVRNFHQWVLVGFLTMRMLHSQIDGFYRNGAINSRIYWSRIIILVSGLPHKKRIKNAFQLEKLGGTATFHEQLLMVPLRYLTINLKIDGCYSTHKTRTNDSPVLRCSLLLLLLLLQKRNDQLVSVSQACFALFGAGLTRASVSLFRTIVL